MDVKIKETTIGEILEVKMKAGEAFNVEPGAVISMQGEVEIISGIQGGLMKGALRAIGGGESAFISRLEAKSDAVVEIGSSMPSELIEIDLDGELLLGDGAYLAHTGNIEISAKFGGLTSILAGSGLMFLKASGKGKLYLCGGGAILKKEVKEGEVFYLDNTALLAIPSGTKIEKIIVGKGLVSKVFSGEGVMFKIYGPTKVIYQIQSPSLLAKALGRYLPSR